VRNLPLRTKPLECVRAFPSMNHQLCLSIQLLDVLTILFHILMDATAIKVGFSLIANIHCPVFQPALRERLLIMGSVWSVPRIALLARSIRYIAAIYNARFVMLTLP
jgi:hypothetical protein